MSWLFMMELAEAGPRSHLLETQANEMLPPACLCQIRSGGLIACVCSHQGAWSLGERLLRPFSHIPHVWQASLKGFPVPTVL